jgi:hypothetical protein
MEVPDTEEALEPPDMYALTGVNNCGALIPCRRIIWNTSLHTHPVVHMYTRHMGHGPYGPGHVQYTLHFTPPFKLKGYTD